MGIPVNIISKFSQFPETTDVQGDDLFLMSQAQDPPTPNPFITKHIKGSNMDAHNDKRYIRKIDVYFSVPLDLLVIEK